MQAKTEVAEANCRSLQLLEDPCRLLAVAAPKDISSIVPNILNRIRMARPPSLPPSLMTCRGFYEVPSRIHKTKPRQISYRPLG